MNREKDQILPIIIALVVAVAPHTPGLPLWINLWCLGMWGYTLARLKTGWPIPGTLVRYGLTFIAILGLLLTFQARIGGDAFVGLLALMAAIKPFEMPTHRHRMITILLTYFIIITSLFRSDSIFIVLYMFFSVFVTTTALVRINLPQGSLGQSRKLAGTILAQAIPLMAILFLVFPRLPGSVFGIQDKTRAKTGFSELMQPGSISNMALNQETAFRAEFYEKLPEVHQLYWRGIVFQQFDGKTWRPGPPIPANPPRKNLTPGSDLENEISYTIGLEPHNNRWLMSLDRPMQSPSWAKLDRDFTLKARKAITQTTRYKLISSLPLSSGAWERPLGESPRAKQIIAKADRSNPRARKLAIELAKNVDAPREKADKILTYFSNTPFVYSLTPPLGHNHPLDSFVLDTLTGYCEHYASAFAFMMNVVDVPARVVGGYLGGELNPYGNFLTIRQSYAHAWVEIFDPREGWIRMDPTLVVAPERILTNPDGSSASAAARTTTLSFLRKLQFALDTINLRWEAWFTGYSYFEQKIWLKTLGLIKTDLPAPGILIILTLAGLAVFSIFLIWLFRPSQTRPDPIHMAWDKFCRKLAGVGLVPEKGQGPVGFAHGCTEKRQDLKPEIQLILDLYTSIRYKKHCPDTTLEELQLRIKRFRPKPLKEENQ